VIVFRRFLWLSGSLKFCGHELRQELTGFGNRRVPEAVSQRIDGMHSPIPLLTALRRAAAVTAWENEHGKFDARETMSHVRLFKSLMFFYRSFWTIQIIA
jgi:hypothetical protein